MIPAGTAGRAFNGGLCACSAEDAALEPGDLERIGLLLFATMQGIAALVTAGIVAPDHADGLVADAIRRFLHGPQIPA